MILSEINLSQKSHATKVSKESKAGTPQTCLECYNYIYVIILLSALNAFRGRTVRLPTFVNLFSSLVFLFYFFRSTQLAARIIFRA